MPTRKPILLALLLLTWLTAVLIGYVAGHKPFSAAELLVWLTAAWQTLVAAAILSLAGGLGERILPAAPRSLPRAALTAGIGLAILSLVTLGTGLLLGAGSGFSLAILGLAALFAGRKTLAWLANFSAARSGAFFPRLAWFAPLLLLPQWLTALAPPLAWDALVYHLALPQLALRLGHIAYTPDLMFAGMPQLTEMLYLLAISLGGQSAAAALGFLIGLLGALGLSGYAAQKLSPHAAWGTLFALLAGETLLNELAWGYVDWAAFFYGLLTLISLSEWRETRSVGWLRLAGVFIGLAVSVKYTAGVIFPGALALIALEPGRGWKEKLNNALRLSLPAALLVLPWLMRNAVWTGSPLYPLIFPAGAMTAPRLAAFQGQAPWRSLPEVLILPWQATMLGIEDKEGFSASIGALLLAFSPLAVFSTRRKAFAPAAALTLTGLLVWLMGSRLSLLLIQTRLYLAFFPAWALLAGAGYEFLLEIKIPGLRLGKIINALTALALAFTALTELEAFHARDGAGYWLGRVSATEYRARSLGAYPAAIEAVNALPAGSRVLFLWETRGLDCLPRCDPDETIDRWYEEIHTRTAASAIQAGWQKSGYTHVLVFRNGVEFVRAEANSNLTAADWQVFDQTLAGLTLEREIDGAYELYAIRP